MRRNKMGANMARTWKRDDSKLSEEDLELLKLIHFPSILKPNEVAQKRIAKSKGHGAFNAKQVVSYQDIVFVKTSRQVAIAQIQKHAQNQEWAQSLGDGTLNLASLNNETKTRVEIAADIMAPKPRQMYYIDGNHIQQEMEELLSLYSNPKPTPSMKPIAKTEPIESAVDIANPETVEDTVKQLSPVHKGKAKKMYMEQKLDANEIATELGIEVDRVISYLQTLNN